MLVAALLCPACFANVFSFPSTPSLRTSGPALACRSPTLFSRAGGAVCASDILAKLSQSGRPPMQRDMPEVEVAGAERPFIGERATNGI